MSQQQHSSAAAGDGSTGAKALERSAAGVVLLAAARKHRSNNNSTISPSSKLSALDPSKAAGDVQHVWPPAAGQALRGGWTIYTPAAAPAAAPLPGYPAAAAAAAAVRPGPGSMWRAAASGAVTPEPVGLDGWQPSRHTAGSCCGPGQRDWARGVRWCVTLQEQQQQQKQVGSRMHVCCLWPWLQQHMWHLTTGLALASSARSLQGVCCNSRCRATPCGCCSSSQQPYSWVLPVCGACMLADRAQLDWSMVTCG